MYRKFALFAVTLSVFSVVLMGCPKAEDAAAGAADAAKGAAGSAMDAGKGAMDAGKGAAMSAGKGAMDAGKGAMAGAMDAGKGAIAGAIDPAAITKTINAVPGLEGVKVVKNDKGVLALTGTVANQGLKTKAEELAKAAGITTVMNKITTK